MICIFCQIVRGESPATIVCSAATSLGIVPLNPVTEGHVIFISRKHVADAVEWASVTGDVAADASLYALGWSDTLHEWPEPPALGMVTMVDPEKVEHKRQPGYCYKKAGFEHVGFTQGGLWVWQLLPERMPEPMMAMNTQLELI